MIGDLVTGTEPYCQQCMMPKRPHIWIVPIMFVSVMLIAFSFTLGFGQSSGPVKILSFRSYIDDIDYFHVVGEIENDSPSVIRYVTSYGNFLQYQKPKSRDISSTNHAHGYRIRSQSTF